MRYISTYNSRSGRFGRVSLRSYGQGSSFIVRDLYSSCLSNICRKYIAYIDNMKLQATLCLVIMIGCSFTSSTNNTVINIILVFWRKHTATLLLSIRRYTYIIHEWRKSVTRYIRRSHLDRPSSLGGRINLPPYFHQLSAFSKSRSWGQQNTNDRIIRGSILLVMINIRSKSYIYTNYLASEIPTSLPRNPSLCIIKSLCITPHCRMQRLNGITFTIPMPDKPIVTDTQILRHFSPNVQKR